MRSLSKTILAISALGLVALSASAADARPAQGVAYTNGATRSVPYYADGPAYTAGQRDIDSSNDFQLQGR